MNLNKVGIIGDIILDILLQVDDFPVEDSEVVLKNEQYRLGGSALNTAYELTATQLHPLLLSTFGKDTAGDFIKGALKKAQIDDLFVFREETNTGKIYILLSPNGKRTMISSRSTMPIPMDESIYEKFINNIHWLHVSGYLLGVKEQYERAIFAMKQAKKNGVPVSMDPGTNTVRNHLSEVLEALQHTDYFLPNREEFDLLRKKHALDIGEFESTFIIKEGAKGVSVKNSTDNYLVPTTTIVTTTDSIGAGDAFNAGFILGILTTQDLKTACHKGNEFAAQRLKQQQR
ncbi:MAG: carbohydrate kinase family protein [Thermotogota bacterium]|nr:carbohydrate kinase family protein [Thermotogota bacterium]